MFFAFQMNADVLIKTSSFVTFKECWHFVKIYPNFRNMPIIQWWRQLWRRALSSSPSSDRRSQRCEPLMRCAGCLSTPRRNPSTTLPVERSRWCKRQLPHLLCCLIILCFFGLKFGINKFQTFVNLGKLKILMVDTVGFPIYSISYTLN